MCEFDISKPWAMLVGETPVEFLAEELSHYIGVLRERAGIVQKPPLILETRNIPPVRDAPLIIFTCENEFPDEQKGSGFSWRLEPNRLEIKGESARGLYNAVFDFLAHLGFQWTGGCEEKLPPLNETVPHIYFAEESYRFRDSFADIAHRKRLLFDKNTVKDWRNWAFWAARNQIDALVFPISVKQHSSLFDQAQKAVKKYGIAIESGGWDLSSLVPRTYFFLNREMFRMKSGKREKFINFCPTSPDTLRVLSREAKSLFLSVKEAEVFHFWPDRGYERVWCSCQTCRAFSPDEQNRMAVNAVADVLLAVNPSAKLSYYETSSDALTIAMRPNIFKIARLPETSGVETDGWVFV